MNLKKLGTATDYVEYKETLTFGAKLKLKQIKANAFKSFDVVDDVDSLGNPIKKMVGKILSVENTEEFVLLESQIVNLVESGKPLIKDGVSVVASKTKAAIIKETTAHNNHFETIIDEFLTPINEDTTEAQEKK